MKKNILFVFFIISILSFIFVKFDFVQNMNSITKFNKTFMVKDVILEKKINPNSKVSGFLIEDGGPYKFNRNYIGQGIGVKLSKVGWNEDIYEKMMKKKSSDIIYMVFEVEMSNFSKNSYSISEKDFVLKYGKNQEYKTSLVQSGYSAWSKLEGSFKMSKLPPLTQRHGYIFFPCKKDSVQSGTVTVYLDNIPLEFKY